MSDSLVLELLRAIRGDIHEIKADLRDLKHRMSSRELGVAGICRDIAALFKQHVLSSLRTDTIEERIQRVERRLEIIPQ